MGNFDRGDRRGDRRGGGGFRGGNGGFQKKSWGNDRGSDRDRVMYDAVCTECGANCQVPFRPSGDKPVLCNNCFGGKSDMGDRAPRRDFNDRGPKREWNDRPAPRPDFVRPAGNDDTKKQFAEINTKLDRLASAIEKLVAVKSESKVAPAPIVEKIVKAKVSVKKAAAKKTPKKK